MLVLVCWCILAASLASAADKKELIKQARAAQYNLTTRGFSGAQCNIAPNWELVLQEQRKSDPSTFDAAIRILNQIQFGVSVSSTGVAKTTHNSVSATNSQVSQGLDQIYSGMEQMISGFFQTWSTFVVSYPFPEVESNYELKEEASEYRLSYKEGTADVVTTMTKDLTINEAKVTTPQFTSSIRPQFTRGAQGLLLTSYHADYEEGSVGSTVRLDVHLTYQEVNGMQFPHVLDLSGSYGNVPFQMEVTLGGCQMSKR
jgi:hypothetical protein